MSFCEIIANSVWLFRVPLSLSNTGYLDIVLVPGIAVQMDDEDTNDGREEKDYKAALSSYVTTEQRWMWRSWRSWMMWRTFTTTRTAIKTSNSKEDEDKGKEEETTQCCYVPLIITKLGLSHFFPIRTKVTRT